MFSDYFIALNLAEITSKRAGSSPFQKFKVCDNFLSDIFVIFKIFFKEKLRSFVRPASSSTPTTTISTPDIEITTTNNSNMLSIPNASSSVLSSPSPALGSDIRAVRTMPELQSNNDLSSSSSSTPIIRRSDQEHQSYIKSVIETISSIYEQSLLKYHFHQIIFHFIHRFTISLEKNSWPL